MFASSKDTKITAAKDGMLNEGGHTEDNYSSAEHHFSADARIAAEAVKRDLEDTAHRTGVHVRELADSAGHSLADAGQSMTIKIRENPVQASLIALGLGLTVGLLYRR